MFIRTASCLTLTALLAVGCNQSPASQADVQMMGLTSTLSPQVILKDSTGKTLETLVGNKTLTNLLPGTYTLEPQDVSNGDTVYHADPKTVVIAAGQQPKITIDYVANTLGSVQLQFTGLPNTLTAQVQLNGNNQNSTVSLTTLSNTIRRLAPGSYTLNFPEVVDGLYHYQAKTPSVTVEVKANQTPTVAVNYQAYTQLTVTGATIEGTTGTPVGGSEITVRMGGIQQSAVSDTLGRYSITLKAEGVQTLFDVWSYAPIKDEPNQMPLYVQGLPIAEYLDPNRMAAHLNLATRATFTSYLLSTYPARGVCLTGTLQDSQNNPVVGANAMGGFHDVLSSCDTALAPTLNVPLIDGEQGFISAGGFRSVSTDANGGFILPIRTRGNGFAISSALFAGNFDDIVPNSDPAQPAVQTRWSQFLYVPKVDSFLFSALNNDTTNNAGTQFTAQDIGTLHTKPFDPAVNNQVVDVKLTHDLSTLPISDVTTVTQSANVSFSPAIYSGDIPMGSYTGAFDQRSVRTLKPLGTAQHLTVDSNVFAMLKVDDTSTVVGSSNSSQWRDGTNLNTPINAAFLAWPVPVTPANHGLITAQPKLSWSSVPNATLYDLTLMRLDPAATAAVPQPVWYAVTSDTELTIPVALEAGKQYSWSVSAYAGYKVSDFLAISPLSRQAAQALQLPKGLKVTYTPVQAWRAQLNTQLQSMGINSSEITALSQSQWSTGPSSTFIVQGK